MQGEKTIILYKEVAVALGSLAVLMVIGYNFWLPDLLRDDLLDFEYSVVPNALWKVLLHLYVPAVTFCFVVGEITKNWSQVDKIWSIFPFVFAWYITFIEAGFDSHKLHPRSVLMSSLVTLWGIKLTYGFYLKGGYSMRFWLGKEDYRWVYVIDGLPILKNNQIFKTLFNIVFISIYQLFVIFAFSGGVMVGSLMLRHRNKETLRDANLDLLSISDVIIAVVMFSIISVQIIADVQQQRFQKEKYRRITKKIPLECSVEHYEIGFCTSGLFSYSRHPNFTCEQAIWLMFYTFTIDFQTPMKWFTIGGVFNISIIGVLLLMVLFAKSTDLTEEISKKKYSRYQDYQNNVGRILDVDKILQRIFYCQSPNQNWITNKEE